MTPVITITTDFGLQDGFVGIMKGVALGIQPCLQFVDITHDIKPGDIHAGAWVMANAYRYFPQGSVHLAVVDPGVGSQRRGIVITNGRHSVVCPDNGLITYLLDDRDPQWHAFEITNSELMLPVVSKTFHGRDVFAPVAAHLASGLPANDVGPKMEIANLVRFEKPAANGDTRKVCGCVVYIDRFGNLITNISGDLASKASSCRIAAAATDVAMGATYADANRGEPIACTGSHGYLEIAVNGGSAANEFGAGVGTPVTVVMD